MYQELDKKLIKKSHLRIVISGDVVEVYEYEKPVYYNFPPQEKKESGGDNKYGNTSRRADHLNRTRQTIRRTISSNANAWGCMPVFITYTFAENVQDLGVANEYWQRYKKKLKYKYGHIKYIVVVEFQKRGAIHYHALYFNLPFIENIKKIFGETWGHGFINIKGITEVGNIGAYVSKYLQKENTNPLLIGKKAFFVSRKLNKPIIVRDEEKAKSIRCHLPEDMRVGKVKEYPTNYHGNMKYSQYRLLKEQIDFLNDQILNQ